MLLRSPATNQRPADRTGRPADEDSHRTSSITAARSSAWPSMSFTDEGAASLLLVVLIRCPPWRSYLVQAARHGPALPRAPVRRARRHCGAPTGRHGAERSARDAERGGVRGEMRSRATSSSTMTRSAVRIPPRIGWKDLTRTPSATPSARPAADGSPSRSSFATDVRSCADDNVAKALPDGARSARLVPGRIALARGSAPHAEASAHESLLAAGFPRQQWRRKGHGPCSPQSTPTMDARVTTVAHMSSARHDRERPMLLVHGFLATPRIVGSLAARLSRL